MEYLEITQHIKQNGVSDDALCLSLFPYSLTLHAIAWYDRLPKNSIHSFDDMMRKFLSKYFPPSMVIKLRNEITKFKQKPHESLFEASKHYKLSIDLCPNHNMLLVTQIDTFYNDDEIISNDKAVDTKCETYGGPHSFTECPAVGGYTQETAYATTGTGSLPRNTVPNLQEDLKVITTRSGVTLAGPSVSPPPLSKEVEREPKTITDQMPEVTKDTVQPTTPPVAQVPIYELVVALKPKPTIPYPSRVNKQKLCEKDDNLALKFVEIFRNLHFELSFADALLHTPKFALMFKKFDECLALVDLGVRINLMPLSIWKKLSLPELTSTQMILELADRSTTRPAGIVEDVFVKVGKFHFPIDFVVVDYVVDPRVLLILGRPFLRTGHALIDVYGKELTLRVDDEAITFKVDQTSKYSYNDVESINQVDVIDVACEEYVQEVLGFSNNSKSGNPTLISGPIIALSSLSLTPFEGGDFILEEIEACLTSKSIPSGINDTNLDMKGNIRLLEELLNNDPLLSHLPSKELNVEEIKTVKSSIDELRELELKDLPSYLEYAYLEGIDKLPVIMAKGLKDDEKEALLKEKTTFTCAYGTFAYQRIPFGLYNAPGTFQRCMMAIFHDMIEKTIEVFMDDFLVFEDSFSSCLSHLDTMLQRCKDTNLVLNWEKCHFMVKKGIVLGHKISKNGLEVDRAKVDVIAKLPHPATVKGVRSFLGHAGFYRRFIQDFSKITRPMTHLFEKETSFVFSKDCIDAFETLKKKLTEAPILVVPDWNLPYEFMCDANDFAIHAVLGQRPTGGHNGANFTAKKVFDVGYQDARDLRMLYGLRTAYKTCIGCTPYKLVYGKSCHLPIELEHKAYWALKHANVIIAKDLKEDDKEALLKVLKSHKQAIAWKTTNIKDFKADPRVPLILGRSFLRTGCALIDVYGEEITLRVNDKFVTFNLNQTMRYSSTYDDNSVNRIDVIDITYEEYAQDVLDFKYNSKNGNPTLVSNPLLSRETKSEFCKEPIVKSSSPTLTHFGESDFLLEEIKDFLKDESIPTIIEDSCYDLEGDILYLEKLINDDPSQLPPMDLKQAEETKVKSIIKEPLELELKELQSHLEYAFLEETDKLPVIIAKDLKDDDKEALLKVLKSHKQAIAWKTTNIK
nr:reverse transcriptase domain-containing protein [Tanacetum cinerariifolium]